MRRLTKTRRAALTESIAESMLAGEASGAAGLRDALSDMFTKNKTAVLGAALILLFTLLAVFAPLIARYDPAAIDLPNRLKPPSLAHPLGTDDIGRDVFTRVMYGGRISLMIGLVPSLISMVLGTAMGLIAGYFGGKTDFFVMRLADVMLAFPSLLLAMVVMYTIGTTLINLFVALSIISWAGTARVVRAQTLSLREKEFIEAARSMGVKRPVIMLRHILPNCLPSLIVLFTLDIPAAILSEASLSFLGIGAQPPQASWGLMVNAGKKYAYNCPWLILAPGLAILLIVMAFNFLGDGLRDSIDPYLKT
jgi:ABC-type dipeptide/oligopeptide/nickel transport system permease subunit